MCLVFLVMENKKDFPLPTKYSYLEVFFHTKSLYPPKIYPEFDYTNNIVFS